MGWLSPARCPSWARVCLGSWNSLRSSHLVVPLIINYLDADYCGNSHFSGSGDFGMHLQLGLWGRIMYVKADHIRLVRANLVMMVVWPVSVLINWHPVTYGWFCILNLTSDPNSVHTIPSEAWNIRSCDHGLESRSQGSQGISLKSPLAGFKHRRGHCVHNKQSSPYGSQTSILRPKFTRHP